MSKKVNKVKALTKAVNETITTAATTEYVANHDQSINDVLLQDVRDSVAAIDNAELPRQPEYKLYCDAMALALGDVLAKDVNIAKSTRQNKVAMIKMATVQALESRLVAELATQRLAAATTAAKKASAEKAVAKAADTLANPPTSLDKASKAGRQIVDRKTSTCTGFQKQTAASKAKAAKAKPTKAELAQKAADRKAHKELILQSLDNAKTTALDPDCTPEQAMAALKGVAHCADKIVQYLPADMRTL